MPEVISIKSAAVIVALAGFIGYAIASLKYAWQQANDWEAILQFNNRTHMERRDNPYA